MLHMQAYIVAWDWLLWFLWGLLGIVLCIGVAMLVAVEIANNRKPK